MKACRFKKRPVVIEAIQFTAIEQDWPDGWPVEQWNYTADGLVIPTLEGDHLARTGDWIIRGIKGEYYPCRSDIFAATHERADGAEERNANNTNKVRGRCRVCGFRVRLLKSGMAALHWVYIGDRGSHCIGSGQAPRTEVPAPRPPRES